MLISDSKLVALKTRIFILLAAISWLASCSEPEKKRVPQVTFSELESLLNKDNDSVYVINFWATWCKPCIEELPEFEKLSREYRNRKVKVVLVSLDFPSRYEEQLLPFIKENNIQSKVLHLTDVNANSWIDRIDPSWSGAIPATLIYRGSDRAFFERKLTYSELVETIERKL